MGPVGFKSRAAEAVAEPFEDYMRGFGRIAEAGGGRGLAKRLATAVAALLVSWWIYVPVHELLHVAGCLLGGGSVSRLELSPVYGAHLLKNIFPFIVPASDYAGRLSGFDTGGSDLTYLLTDFLPYVLTIFIGVPLLKSATVGGGSSLGGPLRFGAAIPLAYTPFISITGDYYEMGSIVVTRAAGFFYSGFDTARLRSDDLLQLVKEIFLSGKEWGATDVVVVALSFVLGVVLIFATYRAGSLVSGLILKSSEK